MPFFGKHKHSRAALWYESSRIDTNALAVVTQIIQARGHTPKAPPRIRSQETRHVLQQYDARGPPTHEIERQGRWKQGGGMVGRYTRGETAGSALRYL